MTTTCRASVPLGLYIQIPFCQAKCTYCDFNSYAGLGELYHDYSLALEAELRQAGPGPIRTVYIGGGTPTVLPPTLLEGILDTVHSAFDVQPGAEITVEANPGTLDLQALRQLWALGFNRLSLGVQSFDDGELQLLGRIHTAADAQQAFHSAQRAGFSNVNLDLIYGLPTQRLASWKASLCRALSLVPDHLSLYALEVGRGTPLSAAIARGQLPSPDSDLAADMYTLAEDCLRAAGFIHYEISNWAARPGCECGHNLIYWRNEPYLGIGAGAHSWAGGRRWANVDSPIDYTMRMLSGDCPVAVEEAIPPDLEMGESMMLGLRLVQEGVPFSRFRERFGIELADHYKTELDDLVDVGLITRDAQRVRLSSRGRLLGNEVFCRFLPDEA